MHVRRAATVATLLLVSALVPTSQARAEDCAGDDQSSLGTCADTVFRAADAKLNTHYHEIVGRLADSPDGHRALVAAQRAWIAFRDKECAFAASGVVGGSVYPMIVSGCMTELTEARSARLSIYLACKEGDLSCPVP